MQKNKLKLLSYNIHKGFSLTQSFTLEQMREGIRSTSADLVFLQEVQGEHAKKQKQFKNWPLASQFEFLADSIWPHYAYGKNAVYSDGHHGNAILSRYPILSSENINISTNRFEQRGLLHAEIEIPTTDKRIHLLCVHLNLLEGGRQAQLKKISSRIREFVPENEPLILAGDFNDWRQTASSTLSRELHLNEAFKTKHGQYCRSFPSFFPILTLDRIYMRGLETHSALCLTDVPWSTISDHNALLVELTIS